MKLAIPTVHLNGTSKGELLRQLIDAINAIHTAEDKLAQACPNGRDYYVQGPSATALAMDQHAKRARALRSARDELEAIAEAVDEQGKRP